MSGNSLKREAQESLQKNNLQVLKSLGQNFLIDENVVKKIIRLSGVKEGDTVLEVGPGLGALTRYLLPAAGRVVVVEKDAGLAKNLAIKFADSVEVKNSDILKVDLSQLGLENFGFKVLANLPFNVGTAILRWFFEQKVKPEAITVILQKEVVDRILEKGGKTSVLSLFIKLYGEPERLFDISRASYYPAPRVDTSVLRIVLHQKKRLSSKAEEVFQKIVKTGFSSKRKLLRSNLAKKANIKADLVESFLKKKGLSAQARAEELSFSDWVDLVEDLVDK